jgi:hypothetical protein
MMRYQLNERTKLLAINAIKLSPDGYVFSDPKPATRSVIQNDKMWAMLTDVSKQVPWPVNGVMQKLPPEDWKAIITASLETENRMAMGINGGYVMLGKSTSKMSIKEMNDVIDFLFAFGAEKCVRWSASDDIPEWVTK